VGHRRGRQGKHAGHPADQTERHRRVIVAWHLGASREQRRPRQGPAGAWNRGQLWLVSVGTVLGIASKRRRPGGIGFAALPKPPRCRPFCGPAEA
jgi:hypothetical protein